MVSALIAMVTRIVGIASFRRTAIERPMARRAGDDLAVRILSIMYALAELKLRCCLLRKLDDPVVLGQGKLAAVGCIEQVVRYQAFELSFYWLAVGPFLAD